MSICLGARLSDKTISTSTKTNRTKAEWRRELRRARRALSPAEQAQHALGLQKQFLRTGLLLRYQRFAIYLPSDGEIGTYPIIQKLFEAGKDVALPKLVRTIRRRAEHRHNLEMRFVRYEPGMRLSVGAFGLLEPEGGNGREPFIPDVVLMPLVGVDQSGTRLGMGGGFYDAYLRRGLARNALRVGLAHEMQFLREISLPRDEWDLGVALVLHNEGVGDRRHITR